MPNVFYFNDSAKTINTFILQAQVSAIWKLSLWKITAKKGFEVEEAMSDYLENTYWPFENTGNCTEK